MAKWGAKWTTPVEAPVAAKQHEKPYRATCGDHVYYFRALDRSHAYRKADLWFWKLCGGEPDTVEEQG